MTKKYKVGDTIYLKDTVADIDVTDPLATYRGHYNGWVATKTIIDELPTAEPVKPVLPEDVANEMEEYKATGFDLVDYFSAFNECADDVKNSSKYARDNTHEVTEARIGALADAWNHGYTIEQVPRYMVYVPGTNKKFLYNKRGDSSTRAAKLETPIVPSPVTSYQTAYGQYKPLYWFTDEEITKFDLQDCEKEPVADDSED